MKAKAPLVLRRVVSSRLRTATAFFVGFAAVASVLVGVVGVGDHETGVTPARQDLAPPSRVDRLIDRHDCWTGEAPPGVIPRHAVVTLPDHAAQLLPADVGFGIWLDGDPGTLHAFCP